MPLRDGFFSTATQTSCCNRIQRSNRVRLLVVSTHDFPDIFDAPASDRGLDQEAVEEDYKGAVPSGETLSISDVQVLRVPRVQFHYGAHPQVPDRRGGGEFCVVEL